MPEITHRKQFKIDPPSRQDLCTNDEAFYQQGWQDAMKYVEAEIKRIKTMRPYIQGFTDGRKSQ